MALCGRINAILDGLPFGVNLTYTQSTPATLPAPSQNASTYFTVSAGTYRIRAGPAGTAPANRAASVIIDLNNVALAGATGRTIVTADNNVGGAPLRAFLLTDR